MNTVRITGVLVVLAILFLATPGAVSAQQEGEQPAMTPEMQAEMEAWMKLAQPGTHHEHLAPFVGTWKGEVKMWMATDGEPVVDESLAVAAWLMGGRYLEWKHTGHFGGMPFTGLAIEGYNNGDERYESVWMDNFGTLIMFFTGSCSNGGRSREMTSQFTDPFAGRTIGYRTEYQWLDDDHFTYTAYMDKGDGEYKNLVITYARQ